MMTSCHSANPDDDVTDTQADDYYNDYKSPSSTFGCFCYQFWWIIHCFSKPGPLLLIRQLYQFTKFTNYVDRDRPYSILDCLSQSLLSILIGIAEPALEPPAPPGRGGPHDPQGPHVTAGQFFYCPYSITSHTCTILFSANHTMTQLLRAYRPTSKSVCHNNL